MGIVGRQFGQPDGIVGGFVGRFMARNNAGLNRWAIAQLARRTPEARRILDIGPGPGVGTRGLLASFPQAEVLALEPSPVMLRQLRRRNRAALSTGRLRTIEGTLQSLEAAYRADLAVAVHVVYFWRDPEAELAWLHDHLEIGGMVALGYQLGEHMPAVARRDFPASGHRLIESDDALAQAATAAGLSPDPVSVLGDSRAPTGRLLVATRTS